MRPSLRQQLANFLRQRRRGRSFELFAMRTGISAATLCRLEACTTNFSAETLEQLCWAFNCTLADIFPYEFANPVLQPLPLVLPSQVQPVPLSQASLAERPV